MRTPPSSYLSQLIWLRRWCVWLTGAGLTLLLLFWVFRNVSLTQLGSVLSSAQYSWIAVAFCCYLSAFFIRAHRWGILLGISHNPGSYGLRLAAVFIGFGSSQFLPANIGEILRAGLIKRLAKIPFGTVLGSILTMRLFDGLIAFLFLWSPLFSATNHLPLGGGPMITLAAVILISGGLFWAAAHHPKTIAQGCSQILNRVGLGELTDRISTGIQSVLGGLAVLQFPVKTAIVLLDTIAIWSISGLAFWITLLALGITKPGLPGALFIQSMEAMATFLPSLPGHLGAFEAAVRFSLDLYQVPSNQAVGYVLIMRLIVSGSLIVPFMISVMSLGLRRSDFFAKQSRPN